MANFGNRDRQIYAREVRQGKYNPASRQSLAATILGRRRDKIHFPKLRRVPPLGRFSMKPWLVGLACADQPIGFRAIDVGARAPIRLGSEFHQAAAGHAPGRGLGRGGEFEGQHLRATRAAAPSANAFGATASQILEFDRDGGFIRESRQEPLCLGLRAHGAHRQGRQHLGDRQGLGHDRQDQPGRPRADGVRPQDGSLRRRGARA